MDREGGAAPELSVVVPVYREGRFLGRVIGEICSHVETLEVPYELILVDDGSPDETWQVIGEEALKRPQLRAVRLSRNFGKECALSAGLEMSQGRAVVVMDGDLQHPPELIPAMVKLWREGGVEVVEAVKEDRGSEAVTGKIGSWLFYSILNTLSGYDLRGASDFKLLDRRVVEAWRGMKESSLFFRGMSAWLGFRRARIPFAVPEREAGTSRWSVFRLVRLAVTAVTSFSSIPLHFVTLTGGVFFLIALLLGGHTVYMKLAGKAVSGFATVILLLLIIGSALMIGLGVIGEYIARIYEEVKGRPRYVVAEVIEGDKGKDARFTA